MEACVQWIPCFRAFSFFDSVLCDDFVFCKTHRQKITEISVSLEVELSITAPHPCSGFYHILNYSASTPKLRINPSKKQEGERKMCVRSEQAFNELSWMCLSSDASLSKNRFRRVFIQQHLFQPCTTGCNMMICFQIKTTFYSCEVLCEILKPLKTWFKKRKDVYLQLNLRKTWFKNSLFALTDISLLALMSLFSLSSMKTFC